MRENYLLYDDFNSLYSSCMIQELPTGEMTWCNNLDYQKTYDGNRNSGYIYEVDLVYPDYIKDATKYYPFCPENKIPIIKDFSDYQKSLIPKKYRPTKNLC